MTRCISSGSVGVNKWRKVTRKNSGIKCGGSESGMRDGVDGRFVVVVVVVIEVVVVVVVLEVAVEELLMLSCLDFGLEGGCLDCFDCFCF